MTWYVARATGLVLLAVFTAAVTLGVVSSTSSTGRRVPRFVSTELHRRLSLLSLLLLGGHILASVLDGYVTISWRDALVPFIGSYRPFWLGLGTFATDLILAATLTSLLRTRIRPAAWRGIHLSTYAAWPMVVVHGMGTGSDSRRWPVLALTAACGLVMMAALAWRLAARPGPMTMARLAGLMTLPVLSMLVAVWAVQGPLAGGWAKRSGTPPPNSHQPASAQVNSR